MVINVYIGLAKVPAQKCPKCNSVMLPLYGRRYDRDTDRDIWSKIGYDCAKCPKFWRNYSSNKSRSSKKR